MSERTLLVNANESISNEEVGIALSFFRISCAIASTFAFTVPSSVLNVAYSDNNSTVFDYINITSPNSAWHNAIQIRLYYFYSPLIVLLFITCILFIVYSENQPVIPPSAAQVQMRTTESQAQIKQKSVIERVKIFCFEFKIIMFDKTVFQATLLETIWNGVLCSQNIFMGEMLRKLVTESSGYTGANIATSYALLILDISVLIGSIFSGIILDYYKKHVMQIATAFIMLFVFNISISVSYIFKSLNAIYVFNSFLGFSAGLSVTCVYDIAYCYLHPKDPGLINLSMGIVINFGMIIIFQTTRIILFFGGSLYVFIFQSLLLVFAILNSMFIKFKYTYPSQT